MLVHGFPLDHRMWLDQIEPLAEQYRVIVPELRGFGGSTVDSDYTLAELAVDLEQVRIHLSSNQPMHLVGLSMGGYVALEYWAQFRGNLRSLTLANSKPTQDDTAAREGRINMAKVAREQGSWPAVAPMLERLLPPQASGSKVYLRVREMMEQATPEAIAAAQLAMAGRRDFSGQLDSIRVPTLVTTGQLDAIADPEVTRQWATKIPQATFVEFAGSGHLTPMELPEQFYQQLSQFLKQATFVSPSSGQ